MYLRETRPKRADASLVTHLQLVESVWNPHKKRSAVRILHNCGRAALVQLNGGNFLFYNKSLGDLNVKKFTHKHPRRVDGIHDVWHACPHSSRNLHDIGIARKLDWRLYKRLF